MYWEFPNTPKSRLCIELHERCLTQNWVVGEFEEEEVLVAFPETQRVVYEINTLEEVKCQIRFPPILGIEASAPATFQEAVRAEFPYFELKSSVKLPAGVPKEVAQVVERNISIVGGKSYAFMSEDRNWTLSLSKDGLSLSCRRYERWEYFRERLSRALDSLATTYRPTFYSHVCVKYKNSVRRKPLGLETSPWSELVQPWVCGTLAVSSVSSSVEAMQHKCLILLPDQIGKVEANFGLGVHQPTEESAFIIEAHVFNDARKERTDVLPNLDTLHKQARLFFRWCITDQLDRAMRPSSV